MPQFLPSGRLIYKHGRAGVNHGIGLAPASTLLSLLSPDRALCMSQNHAHDLTFRKTARSVVAP